MSKSIPAAVIGASGYVGGELLRLIAGHTGFDLRAAVSDSAAGKPVGELFGHLGAALAGHAFVPHSAWLDHVDADGDLDLVIGNYPFSYPPSSQNRLYLNDGAGLFSDATASSRKTRLRGLKIN